MDVVAVYLRYIRIRYDNKGKVTQGLDSMGKSDWEKG